MLVKKIILTLLLIIWMGLIFYFSNQNAIASEATSDKFASTIIEQVKPNLNNTEKENLIKDTRVIVRKTAHFTIFLILGIISYFTFKAFKLKNILLISFLFCLLYAISDEIHQLFIMDRNFGFLDILIDTLGSGVGIVFCIILTKKFDKQLKKC